MPADGLQRVRLGACREVVVDDTALPHALDGDGGVACQFGEPGGVGYVVVVDAVPAVDVGLGVRRDTYLVDGPVYFGQGHLSREGLKAVQRISQHDVVVVIDITGGSHPQGVGVDLGQHGVFAGEVGVVVERVLWGRGCIVPFLVERV